MSVRDLLQTAIQTRGSQAALAEDCGVSQPAICRALKAGRVSIRLAMSIEAATGIDWRRLCPDAPQASKPRRPGRQEVRA